MNEVLKTLKSIRAYLPDQIPDEDLQAILEAGIYAPTAHNDQPWHFTIIQNKEKLQYIQNEI